MNGYIIAYEWTQISGTAVSGWTGEDSTDWHEDWTSPVPYFPATFTAPNSAGVIEIRLYVWDNDFNEGEDRIIINIQ